MSDKEIKILESSLILATERLNTELKDFPLENCIIDLNTEFENMKLEDITKAIKNGSLGLYGRTFIFSIQEVCFWIREYKKYNNGKR